MRAAECFRAKWAAVRVKKTRQMKQPETGSDSIRTAKALARRLAAIVPLLFAPTVAHAHLVDVRLGDFYNGALRAYVPKTNSNKAAVPQPLVRV